GLIQSIVNGSIGLQPIEIIALSVLIHTAKRYRENIPVAYAYVKIAHRFSMTGSAHQLYIQVWLEAVNKQFACRCSIFGDNKKDTVKIKRSLFFIVDRSIKNGFVVIVEFFLQHYIVVAGGRHQVICQFILEFH